MGSSPPSFNGRSVTVVSSACVKVVPQSVSAAPRGPQGQIFSSLHNPYLVSLINADKLSVELLNHPDQWKAKFVLEGFYAVFDLCWFHYVHRL